MGSRKVPGFLGKKLTASDLDIFAAKFKSMGNFHTLVGEKEDTRMDDIKNDMSILVWGLMFVKICKRRYGPNNRKCGLCLSRSASAGMVLPSATFPVIIQWFLIQIA